METLSVSRSRVVVGAIGVSITMIAAVLTKQPFPLLVMNAWVTIGAWILAFYGSDMPPWIQKVYYSTTGGMITGAIFYFYGV